MDWVRLLRRVEKNAYLHDTTGGKRPLCGISWIGYNGPAPSGAAILTNSGVAPIQRQAALRGITDEFEVYELPLRA